jgi:DNA repair protein RadC
VWQVLALFGYLSVVFLLKLVQRYSLYPFVWYRLAAGAVFFYWFRGDNERWHKKWPEDERPREKMQKSGADSLSDAELLALILRVGDHASHQSAIDLGRNMLQTFGDLRKLSSATFSEICSVKGPVRQASSVLAALALGRRINTDKLENLERFTALPDFQSFHYRFRDRRREYFVVLLLDGKTG